MLEAEDLEAEVRTDEQTGGAARAAGVQLRVMEPRRVDPGGHRQHPRRARGDAQLAALAGFDVDGERAPAGDRGHARPPSRFHAGTVSGSTAPNPARSAASFTSRCWRR